LTNKTRLAVPGAANTGKKARGASAGGAAWSARGVGDGVGSGDPQAARPAQQINSAARLFKEGDIELRL
jgi:hypothetical protein